MSKKRIFRSTKIKESELLRLSCFGIIVGTVSGFVIVLFRFLIEYIQASMLAGGDPENYESLSPLEIFLFPLAGGILIGAIFHFIPANKRQVGIGHTLDYLKNHNARLPFSNAAAQFIGGIVTIVAGHSVGREGPSVHLGAASGSLIGQYFKLDNTHIQILLGCGVSAAIAASFNTPIAGVIFALEVILLEYAVLSIMPIIISALAATLISHAVFGDAHTFITSSFAISSKTELISITTTGIIIGLAAAIFIRSISGVTKRTKHYSIFWRLTLAGAITGILAQAAPEIMSLGYDTIEKTLNTEILLSSLLLIIILKIAATSIGLGLGLPGGLIGPTLVIGALIGSAVGIIAQNLFPESAADPGLYAMIGMGAMMAATLQAPLAALMAIFELTLNANIVLPGLIAIVAASLTCSELFGQPSIFTAIKSANTTKPSAKDPGN